MTKRILLGMTTGESPKTVQASLITGLLAIGEVQLITTKESDRFLEVPHTLLTKIKRYRDLDCSEWRNPIKELCGCDIFIIAPINANTLGKIANGVCDDLLTRVARAWSRKKPFLLAPDMDSDSYTHPVTVEHVTKILDWDFISVVPPNEIELGPVKFGIGAMADIADIINTTRLYLEGKDDWRGP